MEGITTALTTSMSSIGASITSIFASALPIALPIIGGVLVATKGIGLFKKITNKA